MTPTTPTTDIEAVVFDIGGVLLDWNPRHLYRKLFRDEEAMNRFLDEICTLEWHDAHDRGVPFERSCAELAARHPEHSELIWSWARRSEEMIAGPLPDSVAILRDLKEQGVRCYALTNMEAETYPLRRARFDFLTWFDGTLVSAFEGIAKPDLEIFLRLLDRFDLRPETTLMIDDSCRNIDAAAQVGMPTVRFTTPGDLRTRLERAGVLSSPG
jgi:2-haloacid dehalogenase